jgi:hypothetical protein
MGRRAERDEHRPQDQGGEDPERQQALLVLGGDRERRDASSISW